jgi:homoserine kinase type II
MKSVFILQHVRQDGPDDEDEKIIGIYSTKENAEKTIEKYKKKDLPGFKDYPDSFYIDEYELDKDHWTEGFGIDFEDM